MKIIHIIDEYFEQALLVILFTSIVFLIGSEVFRRYVLNESTAWAQQVSIFLYVFASWIGAAYGVRMRIHLQMSAVQDRLPTKFRFIIITIGNVLFIVLMGIMTYYASIIAEVQYTLGRSLVGVQVRSFWFYALTPIATMIITIRVAQNIYEDVITYQNTGEIIESEAIFLQE